jgi:hypothetical protein
LYGLRLGRNRKNQIEFGEKMETENTTPERKTSLWKWLGLIVLVVLLATAAFVGGQLLTREANRQTARPGGPIMSFSGEGGGDMGEAAQSFEINVIPAEELPKTQPDGAGIFVRREDNSIFIGTGKVILGISSESEASPSGSYDGLAVEVVVNSETTIYKEVTLISGGPPTSGEIQQEVAEGTIEDIGDNSTISVWGRKVGDRIIADVLLYSDAMIMMVPKP